MGSHDRNWAFSLGTAWPGEETDAGDGVVTIEDPDRGVKYEVVLTGQAGKPAIKRIVIDPLGKDGVLTQAILDRVPIRELARQAHAYREGRLRNVEGAPVRMSTPRKGDPLAPEEVAKLYNGGAGRQEFAAQFHISPKTADDWIRKARDRGLIAPSRAGRPKLSRGNEGG